MHSKERHMLNKKLIQVCNQYKSQRCSSDLIIQYFPYQSNFCIFFTTEHLDAHTISEAIYLYLLGIKTELAVRFLYCIKLISPQTF